MSFLLSRGTTRELSKDDSITFLGIGYLFIGTLDLLHTLSYKGMPIFTDYDYYANQLWIAARYMESITLLLFFMFAHRQWRVRPRIIGILFASVSGAVILSVFVWKVFPVCFVDGVGLTPFKKNSEYVICVILLAAVFFAYKRRACFHPRIFRYLMVSILLTIGSELAFTFYVSNYGFSNMVGHYLKIASFYLIYKALIETGLKEPLQVMFKMLTQNEQELKELNRTREMMLSIMAHDLRGPFGNLVTTLTLLDEGELNADLARELMTDITQSIRNIQNMLETLTVWGAVAGKNEFCQPEDLDVWDVIEQGVEAVADVAAHKQVHVTVCREGDEPLRWRADRNILQTVLRNLLHNAVKFSHPGGEVRVGVRVDSEGVLIDVADQGVGMSREAAAALLSGQVNRSELGTKGEKGAGLGLMLSKELLASMHAKLGVVSRLEKGTTFTITLRNP